jgi:hypothetical protein
VLHSTGGSMAIHTNTPILQPSIASTVLARCSTAPLFGPLSLYVAHRILNIPSF